MIIDLDLTDLFAYTQTDVLKLIRQWQSKKDDKTHKTIRLAVWPLKPENVTQYKTHSVKIDTFKPETKDQVKSEDIPF
jgi:hypothetical protein